MTRFSSIVVVALSFSAGVVAAQTLTRADVREPASPGAIREYVLTPRLETVDAGAGGELTRRRVVGWNLRVRGVLQPRAVGDDPVPCGNGEGEELTGAAETAAQAFATTHVVPRLRAACGL